MSDAVVLPGREWGGGAPLPRFTGDLAAERGATVPRLSWAGEPPTLSGPPAQQWVSAQVVPLLDRLGGPPPLIGKAPAANAGGPAAPAGPAGGAAGGRGRHRGGGGPPPPMDSPHVAAALRRATAPFLLVGGTADRIWDG